MVEPGPVPRPPDPGHHADPPYHTHTHTERWGRHLSSGLPAPMGPPASQGTLAAWRWRAPAPSPCLRTRDGHRTAASLISSTARTQSSGHHVLMQQRLCFGHSTTDVPLEGKSSLSEHSPGNQASLRKEREWSPPRGEGAPA